MVVVKVWDGWLRLFHWSIVLLLIVSYVTAKTGRMEWHMLSGYAMLALLLFRIAWGFVGSDSARFARFLRGPGAVRRHLRGLWRSEADEHVGHNAAGGWMVMLLIGLLLAQVLTGLFSDDEEYHRGPFADWVGFEASQWITGWHQRLFNAILAAVALHVAAVAFYGAVVGRNLVRPMITGRTEVAPDSAAARTPPALAGTVRGVLVAVLAGGVVVAFWSLAQPR